MTNASYEEKISKSKRSRMHSQSGGFSLIELAIVLVLIFLLAGVGIVSFMKMRQKSYNASAQSAAVHVAKTQAVFQSNNSRYAVNMDELLSVDRNLTDSPGVTFVWLAVTSSGYTINVRHNSGNRWYTSSQ
jgi:type II secretory pathway pseudopilin PulG